MIPGNDTFNNSPNPNNNRNQERDQIEQQKIYSQVSVNKHSLDEPISATVVKKNKSLKKYFILL